MTLRCKPGDLAVIVGSTYMGGICNGCLLRCLSIHDHESWNVEPLSPRLLEHFNPTDDVMLDRYLRPIRDPGDDAVDETLLSKPAPEWESAHYGHDLKETT